MNESRGACLENTAVRRLGGEAHVGRGGRGSRSRSGVGACSPGREQTLKWRNRTDLRGVLPSARQGVRAATAAPLALARRLNPPKMMGFVSEAFSQPSW